MNIIDRYIIKKFLGTFFFSMALILLIVVIFDISEKIDDFIEKEAPLRAIIFDYYLNFIPHFSNLFSPLFTFIAVIFFTAKMASNTEIIAILNSGLSFKRILFPYFISALFLAALSFYLNAWVIPPANKTRLAFENTYIKNPYIYRARNIHRQISPGNFIYFESFNNIENIGYRFSLEKIKDGKLYYKLMAERAKWDSTAGKWRIENYFIRNVNGVHETIRSGNVMDTALAFYPSEFSRRINNVETMDHEELNKFIDEEKLRGSENIVFAQVEKHKRISFPFATFILTLMGFSLSSHKVRGGTGVQIGIGIALSFTYILFMQISTTFATNGNVPALIAVWIPNIIFAVIGFYLFRKAPR